MHKHKLRVGSRVFTITIGPDGRAQRIDEMRSFRRPPHGVYRYRVWAATHKRNGHYPVRDCLTKRLIDQAEALYGSPR